MSVLMCVCVVHNICRGIYVCRMSVTYRITCTVPGNIDIGKCAQDHRTGNQ